MSYANDDTWCKSGQGIQNAHSPIQFTIDLSFVQDVRTGNVEDGFLSVGAADWEGKQQ